MKISSVFTAIAAVAMANGVYGDADKACDGETTKNNKICICHCPPGNPGNCHTIEVDDSAWKGHKNHELDYQLFTWDPNDDSCPSGGSSYGDPHFQTWAGEKFDFHGICDLALLENPTFKNGLGIDVHIRTAKVYMYSCIAAAVVRIGEDTLEVMGNVHGSLRFWINGVAGDESITDKMVLSETLSGYPITVNPVSSKETEFTVSLDNYQTIKFSTHRDFVRVDFFAPTKADFGESVGLLGTFSGGKKVGRDMITVFENVNEFGQEWQVRNGNLFHSVEGPQFPETCTIPTKSDKRQRRLGEHIITQEEAELACSRVSDNERDLCVFDVLELNELDIAGAY